MIDVSIIIVNYNTVQLTLNCIESIYNFTKDINFEVIIVDNASSDNSVERIQKHFPQVVLIQSTINLGFGKANNLGATYAEGTYLFMLNSDTVLIENSIKYLFDFYTHNKNLNIGVLGCLLIDENNSVNGYGSKTPSIRDFFKMRLNKLPFFNFTLDNKLDIRYDGKDYFNIDYVIGADMFMAKNLFEEVKGFDPNYFMYYEESDIQLEIRNRGYENFIYTGTKIIHLEGKSFNNNVISNFKRIILHSSELYFFKKNYSKFYNSFRIFDSIILLMNLLNFKYSLKENINYIKTIFKL